MTLNKTTLVVMTVFLSVTTIHAGDNIRSLESKMLLAYAEGQFELAETISRRCDGSEKAQLVAALCDVYNLKNQKLSRGLRTLVHMYRDEKLASDIRCQAGMSYARVAQTLSMRNGLYDEVKGIDYDDVYLSIIKSYSSTPFALMAAMYLAQGWFECGDRNKADEAFVLLDSVIDNCHEKPQLLTPLYYMMADQYIIHGKRYDKAVDQLQAALQSGVVNPRTREQITFRIARINDVDLGRRETSRLWYERFLREFPTSSDVALVKRYLRELVKPDSGRTPDADSKR